MARACPEKTYRAAAGSERKGPFAGKARSNSGRPQSAGNEEGRFRRRRRSPERMPLRVGSYSKLSSHSVSDPAGHADDFPFWQFEIESIYSNETAKLFCDCCRI